MISIRKNYDDKQISNLENRFYQERAYNVNNNTILNNIKTNDIGYYIIKPFGRKCYLWFTYIDNKFLSLIKFVNDNDFYSVNLNFDNTLSYNNVLLYGYFFNQNNVNYFVIDNIVNYNNYNYVLKTKEYNIENVFKIYTVLFKHCVNSSNNYLQIHIPYITDDYNKLFNNIYSLAYKPHSISLWNSNKNIGHYILNNSNNISEVIFKVTANPNHDTYNLYCVNKGNFEYHNRCLVRDYKLSKYMNSLFRNIVENKNLDLLEESEDEDDFENIDENKYVYLDKYYYFKCTYNKRFKKWVPKIIVDKPNFNDIVTKKQLIYIEKK